MRYKGSGFADETRCRRRSRRTAMSRPKRTPVSRDRAILGGTPVFRGTRVPVRTLLDYLEAGDPMDDFLEDFPSVTRAQAVAVLEAARLALVADARPPR